MSATLHPLRAARADALYARLVEHGGDDYEGVRLIVPEGEGWTRSMLDRALDDLHAAGRIALDGSAGFVDVAPVLDSGAGAQR